MMYDRLDPVGAPTLMGQHAVIELFAEDAPAVAP